MQEIPPRTLFTLLAVLLIVAGFVALLDRCVTSCPAAITYYGERVAYALDPSAKRAYEYGTRHFDHSQPLHHNIDRAEYFFRQTIKLNPGFSRAHHQLARIHFLRGNFSDALSEINYEILLQGDQNPNAYYVRGLIKGFAQLYESAAADFKYFLTLEPDSWAGANDYAWVAMKAGEYAAAIPVLETALEMHPDNAWLLNSYAIALYETGAEEKAIQIGERAKAAVELLNPQDWSAANPGNDPRIAAAGLDTFRKATIQNLSIMTNGQALNAVQLR